MWFLRAAYLATCPASCLLWSVNLGVLTVPFCLLAGVVCDEKAHVQRTKGSLEYLGHRRPGKVKFKRFSDKTFGSLFVRFHRFHALGPIYYRGSDGAILVYDITDEDSFQKVKNWVKELKKMLGSDIVIAIVGNKTDLEKDRHVPADEAER